MRANKFLRSFEGGFYDPRTVQDGIVPENASTYMYNVDTSTGIIRVARGFTKLTSYNFPSTIQSIWQDTYDNKIYVVSGGRLFQLDGTTYAVTSLTASPVFSTTSRVTFVRQGDYIFMVDGTVMPVVYNTATALFVSSGTHYPASWGSNRFPLYAITWNGRIFCFVKDNNTTGVQYDFIFYSKLYDALDWRASATDASAGGAFQIGQDGTRITAMYPFNEQIWIGKEKGLYSFGGSTKFQTSTQSPEYDQTTFNYSYLYPNITIASPYGVVAYGGAVYFWGKNRVYTVFVSENKSQTSSPESISDMITSSVIDSNSAFTDVQGVFDTRLNRIWFNACQSATSTKFDRVFCYSPVTKAWSGLRQSYNHFSYANAIINGEIRILSGGYSGSNYLYLQDQGATFDGTPIDWQYTTPYMVINEDYQCKPKYVTIFYKKSASEGFQYNYALDFSASTDEAYNIGANEANASTWHDPNSDSTSTWGDAYPSGTTGTWQSEKTQSSQFRIANSGHRIKHQFSSTGLSGDCDIISISVSYTTIGDKGTHAS
jgi:hypothetical protein